MTLTGGGKPMQTFYIYGCTRGVCGREKHNAFRKTKWNDISSLVTIGIKHRGEAVPFFCKEPTTHKQQIGQIYSRFQRFPISLPPCSGVIVSSFLSWELDSPASKQTNRKKIPSAFFIRYAFQKTRTSRGVFCLWHFGYISRITEKRTAGTVVHGSVLAMAGY